MCQIRPAQEIWSVCVYGQPLCWLCSSQRKIDLAGERYLDEWKRRMTESEHTREMEREREKEWRALGTPFIPLPAKTYTPALQTSRLPSITMTHTDTLLHNVHFNKVFLWQASQLIVSLAAAYTIIQLVSCGTELSRPFIPHFCLNSLSNTIFKKYCWW